MSSANSGSLMTSVPPLSVGCPSGLTVVPGEPVELKVAVRNDSAKTLLARLKLVGVPPSWVARCAVLGPLPPGQTANAVLGLQLPSGCPPGQLTVGVLATALEPLRNLPTGPTGWAELVLSVAEPGQVELSMPDQVFGKWGARFRVSIRNKGTAPQSVTLSGSSPSGGRVWLSPSSLELAAGASTTVRARVSKGRSLAGAPRRAPFTVRAHGRATASAATATFVQAPYLQAWAVRAMGLVVTVIAFAALAIFVVFKLSATYAPKLTQLPGVKPAPSGPLHNVAGREHVEGHVKLYSHGVQYQSAVTANALARVTTQCNYTCSSPALTLPPIRDVKRGVVP